MGGLHGDAGPPRRRHAMYRPPANLKEDCEHLAQIIYNALFRLATLEALLQRAGDYQSIVESLTRRLGDIVRLETGSAMVSIPSYTALNDCSHEELEEFARLARDPQLTLRQVFEQWDEWRASSSTRPTSPTSPVRPIHPCRIGSVDRGFRPPCRGSVTSLIAVPLLAFHSHRQAHQRLARAPTPF